MERHDDSDTLQEQQSISFMGSQQTRIEKAVAHALAGATVIAPNTRAARRLRLEVEAIALREGSVCRTPDILPLQAWVNRTWTDGLLAGIVGRALLRPNVVAALWEQIIANSASGRELMNPGAAAQLALNAWKLLHDYKLPRKKSEFSGTEETKVFWDWAETFSSRCQHEGWIDWVEALTFIVESCARFPNLPKDLAVFAFDDCTPLQQDLWEALRAAGCHVEVLAPEGASPAEHANVVACEDAEDEIATAALWARAKLEEHPSARIGIIVPGLESLRDRIETIFAEKLHPESTLLDAPKAERCFEISLGRGLNEQPAIRIALKVLRLATSSLPASKFSSLLRSPYLGAGCAEATGRARQDFRLRRKLRATVTLAQLLEIDAKTQACSPVIFRLLADLHRQARKLPATLTRSEWAVEARRLLATVGWPGDGPEGITLRSEEFQATLAWDALLSDFGALDQVLGDGTPADVARELERAASGATFAVENEGAPIQVVGPLAASGEAFDALWMCGLSDEAWPQRGQPNPFLPFGLQKSADMPHNSPEANLRKAERILARLLQSSQECVLSWPQREEDRELRISPLLSRMIPTAAGELKLAKVSSWNDLQKGASIEEFVDELAPAIGDEEVQRRSTQLLLWQSGCPFRAFAQARLAAEPPQEPTMGENPRDRGKITELALQYVWEQLRERQGLDSIPTTQFDRELEAAIERALAEAFPPGEEPWLRKHREIERVRLSALVREWLDVERKREPFYRIQHQKEIDVQIGGLTINGRIDRLDETMDHSFVIIDYKTGGGDYSPSWWELPRPKDPQLPIYAVAQQMQGHDIAGVAFAHIRPGKCKFKGEAVRKDIFGNNRESKRHSLFSETLQAWQPELEKLAGDFLAGRAEVDPKDARQTCQWCHLGALCRVAEIEVPDDDDPAEETENGE